jgi:hypothetical protein
MGAQPTGEPNLITFAVRIDVNTLMHPPGHVSGRFRPTLDARNTPLGVEPVGWHLHPVIGRPVRWLGRRLP